MDGGAILMFSIVQNPFTNILLSQHDFLKRQPTRNFSLFLYKLFNQLFIKRGCIFPATCFSIADAR